MCVVKGEAQLNITSPVIVRLVFYCMFTGGLEVQHPFKCYYVLMFYFKGLLQYFSKATFVC